MKHTTTGISGCWTGDTYKAVLKFRENYLDHWDFMCVDTDWGVGIIRSFKDAHLFNSYKSDIFEIMIGNILMKIANYF